MHKVVRTEPSLSSFGILNKRLIEKAALPQNVATLLHKPWFNGPNIALSSLRCQGTEKMQTDWKQLLIIECVWILDTETRNYLSLVKRKPAICICENKDADQLRSNNPSTTYIRNFKSLAIFCSCTAQFV